MLVLAVSASASPVGGLDVLRVLPMLPRARLGQVSEDPDDVPIPNLCGTRRLVRAELNAETEDEALALCHAKLTPTLVCMVYATFLLCRARSARQALHFGMVCSVFMGRNKARRAYYYYSQDYYYYYCYYYYYYY